MKLSQFKTLLAAGPTLALHLPDGTRVPAHFHVTEVGEVTKNFVDCGGKVRLERKINFQLWSADDTDHRLTATKLLSIIELAQDRFGFGDQEIEFEYQGARTIEKFGLALKNDELHLTGTETACLALEACGIPLPKKMISLGAMVAGKGSCTPGSGCC